MTPGSSSWESAFFEERRATSRLKHLVLEACVEKFSYHMRDVLYYIDGFAGEGRYRMPDGTWVPGSPVLAAQIGQRVHEHRPNFHLRCINVEEVPVRFRRLEEATAAFQPRIVEINFQGRFTWYIADILERIKEWPAFFFLDPFGTKGIAFNDLRPILDRQYTTEVLVTLHTAGIAKKAGYFAWMDDPSERKRRTGIAQTRNLALALSVPHEELRNWWRHDREGFEFAVLDHYRRQLRSPHTRMRFTKACPVYYGPPPDGFGPAPAARVCFYLVFATQNQEGLFVMNDCMVKAMETFRREAYAGTLFEFCPPEADRSATMAALEAEILQRFRAREFTIDDVRTTIMQETLLLLSRGEYRDAVLRLARNKQLIKLDSGPPTNRTRYRVAR